MKNTETPAALGVPPDFVVTAADRAERVAHVHARSVRQGAIRVGSSGHDRGRPRPRQQPRSARRGRPRLDDQRMAQRCAPRPRPRRASRSRTARSTRFPRRTAAAPCTPQRREALQFREIVLDTGAAKFATVESRIHRVGDIKDLQLHPEQEGRVPGARERHYRQDHEGHDRLLHGARVDGPGPVAQGLRRHAAPAPAGRDGGDPRGRVVRHAQPPNRSASARGSILFSILINLAGATTWRT